MELVSEEEASNWVTTLPIQEFGFSLHKGAFVDALALSYGWTPTPVSCMRDSSFTVEHVLFCPRVGFPTLHHNEIDVTANLVTEVCHDVRTDQPDLQPPASEVMGSQSANT